MDQSKSIGTVLVVGAGALWGMMGIFVRYFNGIGLGSMEIVALRVFVTTLVLFVWLLLRDRRLLRVRLRDCWCFAGTGLVSIVLFSFCYFKTMEQTSLSVAAVLLYTAPIFVMLLSTLLFHERLTGRKLAACALAFGGCVLVVGLLGNAGTVPGAAVFTGIASAAGYALYSIFGRFALNKGYHPLTVTAYTFFFANLGVVPLTNFARLAAPFENNWAAAGMALLLSLVTTVFPYLLYTQGLTKIESSRASIVASVEPVVATLISALVFGEPISLSGIAGILLVLAAIALLNLPARPAKRRAKVER